jgi:hypothetical protein
MIFLEEQFRGVILAKVEGLENEPENSRLKIIIHNGNSDLSRALTPHSEQITSLISPNPS